MGIDVSTKNAKLWKNEHTTRDGRTFYTYSISISKKNKDGTYKNKGIKVYVQNGVPSGVPNGAVCDIEGFLTLDVFQGRDGEVANPMIFATDVKFRDYEEAADDSFEEFDESIPF